MGELKKRKLGRPHVSTCQQTNQVDPSPRMYLISCITHLFFFPLVAASVLFVVKQDPEIMSEMNHESYPPVFRQQNTTSQNIDLGDTTRETQEVEPIPLIDLQCLNLDKVVEACKDWGLFRLVNHGIPLTLLTQLQDHARKLFSLSFESKQALFSSSPVSYFWGTPALTPSGAALSGGHQIMNWVEGLNVPLSQLSQFQAGNPMLDSFRYISIVLVSFFCCFLWTL